MAWWDDWDAFIGSLVGPGINRQNQLLQGLGDWWNETLLPGAGRAFSTQNQPGNVMRPVVEDIQKAQQEAERKAAIPSATPTPTTQQNPTATTPKGNTAQGEVQDILKKLQDQKTQTQKPATDPYNITNASEVYYPGMTREKRELPEPSEAQKAAAQRRAEKGIVGPGMLPGSKDITPPSNLVPLGQAVNDMFNWDEKKLAEFGNLAFKAGYIKDPTIDITKLMPIWGKMLELSAGALKTKKHIDPWTFIRRYAEAGGGIYEDSSKAKSVTRTSTQTTVTNALTARQLAQAALSQRLGRDANDAEVRKFIKALADEEKKNPTKTTTTVTTNEEGEIVSQDSTTTQGIDAEAFALNWAGKYNKGEAQAYQAAGTLMPWLFEALSAPV